MKTFEFNVLTLNRKELREPESEATKQLDALGAKGWHIVYVRDDAQIERNLLLILEREKE
ncbi:MAG: hypothetical protein ABI231_08560 [Candidatus Tumulicola sp.]